MALFRRDDRTLAQRGEDLAAKYLRKQGYRILERNTRYGRNEVDIIAQEGDTVAIVEVKTRRSDDPVHPSENVNATKQDHLRRAAHRYIAEKGDDETYYRFDVVSIVWPEGDKPTVTLYRNAFPDR
jgi:putative endonuclease